MDVGEAELLGALHQLADIASFVASNIDPFFPRLDVTDRGWEGGLVGRRQAARCVRGKYWISLSCPMGGTDG